MPSCRWTDLPASLRSTVEDQVGTVYDDRPATAGSVSDLATTLFTSTGTVFCKGIRLTNQRAWMHRNEARLNRWLPAPVPRLHWSIEQDGWLLLAFDHIAGRHPDLSVGSLDLPALADTLSTLTTVLTPAPPVKVKSFAARWARYIEPHHVAGSTLVHTDVTPRNFLICHDTAVYVLDWAMPAVGAAWIDTAFMVVRLIRAGHQPAQAEHWARRVPAWEDAPATAVTAFAAGVTRLWNDLQTTAPASHRPPLTVAAQRWWDHRRAL